MNGLALLLLLFLTALLVLLPMLPALLEWARPADVVPLHIDTQDALEPPFLASSFAQRLAAALARGQVRLGSVAIARAPSSGGEWPFDADEWRTSATERIWHSEGDLRLPHGVSFLAEVVAQGRLETGLGGVYRGLCTRGRLHLVDHGTVLDWAHGRDVHAESGCRLQGRVSADRELLVCGPATFGLLHAPRLNFGTPAAPPPPADPVAWMSMGGDGMGQWPDGAVLHADGGRVTSAGAMAIAARRGWRGDVVCGGDLRLGAGCSAEGSLKSRGDLVAAARCAIGGNVVAVGAVELGPDCTVQGAVISETAIRLWPGCVVGAPGRPATVAAPRIEVAPGVVVFGTVWAGESGRLLPEGQGGQVAAVAAAEPAPSPWRHAAVAQEVPV